MKSFSILVLSTFIFAAELSAEPYFNVSVGYGASQYYSASDLSFMAYTGADQKNSDTSDLIISFSAGYESVFDIKSLNFEVGYTNFGQNSINASGNNFPGTWVESREVQVSSEMQALTLSFLMKKTLAPNKVFYGKVGLAAWDGTHNIDGRVYDAYDLSGNVSISSDTDTESGTDILYGLGFDFSDYTLKLEHYVLGDITTDIFTFGVKF